MEKYIEKLENLKKKSNEIKRIFIVPLHTQTKDKSIESLKILKQELVNLSNDINTINNKQFLVEINPNKVNEFSKNLIYLSNKVNKQLFFEINKKDIRMELVNIKESIKRPQEFYDLEESIRSEINLVIEFLENSIKKIENRYIQIRNKKQNPEELIVKIEHKDRIIKELQNKLSEYKWVESKEKVKTSKVSTLERELLEKTKITEQNHTLLKMHIIQVEKELNSIYSHIKKLNNDITYLDNSYREREKISLELIKELKDELLSTKHVLLDKK